MRCASPGPVASRSPAPEPTVWRGIRRWRQPRRFRTAVWSAARSVSRRFGCCSPPVRCVILRRVATCVAICTAPRCSGQTRSAEVSPATRLSIAARAASSSPATAAGPDLSRVRRTFAPWLLPGRAQVAGSVHCWGCLLLVAIIIKFIWWILGAVARGGPWCRWANGCAEAPEGCAHACAVLGVAPGSGAGQGDRDPVFHRDAGV